MKRALYLVPLLLFMVLAGYFTLSLTSGRDIHELPSAMIAKPAPGFDMPGIDGGPALSLAGLKGQPAVINFFASWCVPCRIEHPLLMRLAQENHLAIYGIAYKDKPEDSAKLLQTYGDPYKVIGIDRSGSVGLDFGVYGVPETYVLDKDGIIRKRFVGPLNAEAVEKELLPLLRQLGQAASGPAS
jgi:cytochrome c biogenesis protein CcmG/thiol:disulfide interchange protein DsbE